MFGPGRSRGYREEARRPPGQSRDASVIPAPGRLEILQELLNTLNGPDGTDALQSPLDLSDWLSKKGLLPAGLELDGADLERARAVRAGLRALVRVHGRTGKALGEPDPEAVARLDRAAVGARAQVRFDRDGSSRFDLVSRTFEDALGALLAIVHMAQADGTWSALKVCAHPRCRQVFFDFTKGSNGKWCTRRCGDKIRAQTHRRRQKAKGRR